MKNASAHRLAKLAWLARKNNQCVLCRIRAHQFLTTH